jgi:hypothetical protein
MSASPEEPVFIGPADYSGAVHVRECGLCNGHGSHEFGRCASCAGGGLVSEPTCHRCGNTRGGVPGNEHYVESGELLCDYCSADDLLRTIS